LIAYEENADFAYAFGERSAEDDAALSLRFRRVLLIKPGLLVVDDLWGRTESPRTVGRVGWTPEPVVVPPDAKGPVAGLEQLRWSDTDDPVGDLRLGADDAAKDAEPAEKPASAAVRTICLFRLGDATGDSPPLSFEPLDARDAWQLTLRAGGREFAIELPRCYVEPGWITATAADAGEPIGRRALPAGILPHGEQGVRLIERWDRRYRGNQRPGWDTGLTAEDLQHAVEQGHIKPCRVIDLGCGSGTNAVYLAGKEFDVTAVDVAPTALAIAQAKAEEAGVQVRWLLADVLNLPDLGTFDLIFDRGCYHNVRYVDAARFVESMRQLMHPGSRALIVSCNRDGPPGVREQTMRDDFAEGFEFVWLKPSEIQTGADAARRHASWSLMLKRR
jgi:SAM-dependent methyltransferase